MTNSSEHTSINTSLKGDAVIDLLQPRYTQEDQVRLEDLRSRVNVARALLAARVEQGLTQAELGKAAGTKQSRVSEIEAMKGNPRFDTVDRIARVLGLMVTLLPRQNMTFGAGVIPEGYRPIGRGWVSGRVTATPTTSAVALDRLSMVA